MGAGCKGDGGRGAQGLLHVWETVGKERWWKGGGGGGGRRAPNAGVTQHLLGKDSGAGDGRQG